MESRNLSDLLEHADFLQGELFKSLNLRLPTNSLIYISTKSELFATINEIERKIKYNM